MSHLLAILVLVASLAACLGYGFLWLRLLQAKGSRSRIQEPLSLLYAAALGMGTLAYLVLGAGLVGYLTRPVLGALVVLGWVALGVSVLSARRGQPAVDASTAEISTGRGNDGTAQRVWGLGLILFGVFLAVATLFSALKPVDGLDWDSLSYHLAAPKLYLEHGRIGLIAYDHHTQFPFTMEMLYTLGLGFGGAAGAKLFHWAAGWLTALAIGVWTSRLRLNGRPVPAWTGPLAALLFISMPVVLWELGTGYVDLATALFQFLALTALVDWAFGKDEGGRMGAEASGNLDLNPQPSTLNSPILAGVLSGFALGTKYTALLQFGLLGLGLLWMLARAEPARRGLVFRATFAFGLAGLAVASPWYVKNWFWVHNPVYPFFYSLFPHSFSWTARHAEAYSGEQTSFGMGRGPAEFLKVLWNLGLHGRQFYINDKALIGDKVGSLGPVWVGLLPVIMWARGLNWRLGALLLYSGASIGMWFFLSQQVRYLTPVFAPLAVVAAVALALASGPLVRIGAGIFVAVALLGNFWMHAPQAEAAYQVVSGQVSEKEYLTATLPGLYEAAEEWVNKLPAGSRVALYQEARGYYFDRPYFWANDLHHNMIPYDRLQNGEELADELKRFGITHVLINRQFVGGVEGSKWYQLLMDAIKRERLRPVFQSRNHDERQPPVVGYALQ